MLPVLELPVEDLGADVLSMPGPDELLGGLAVVLPVGGGFDDPHGLGEVVLDAGTAPHRSEAERTHKRFEITCDADDDDAMRETIAVLFDESLLANHLSGLAEVEAGDTLDAAGLRSVAGEESPDTVRDDFA